MVDEETGRVVDPEHKGRGYELTKGKYVKIDDNELKAIEVESTHTIDIDGFVPRVSIDKRYVDKPYYIAPNGKTGAEAFVVIRDALKKTKKVGIGQLAMRGQEYVVSLKPCGRGMVLETLRYADEVNRASSYFRDIGDAKPDPDLLEMAETLIEKKTSDFDAKEFENRYIDALKQLIAEKQKKKGKRIIQDEEPDRIPKGSNVVDLMAALKKSLGDDRKPAAKKAAPHKPAARRTPAKKAAPARKRA